jgi:hypothetical protein
MLCVAQFAICILQFAFFTQYRRNGDTALAGTTADFIGAVGVVATGAINGALAAALGTPPLAPDSLAVPRCSISNSASARLVAPPIGLKSGANGPPTAPAGFATTPHDKSST